MVKKARKYTSPKVPSKKEREAAEAEGSKFLTEKDKDEIEKDMESGESKSMAEANKKAEKMAKKKK